MADETVETVDADEVIENDPTEYIPVMRHHLHMTLLSVQHAKNKQQAEDLAQAYRDGEYIWKSSKLAEQLTRTENLLAGYLGLLDEPEPDGPDPHESVSTG